jgi:hypothetical protein
VFAFLAALCLAPGAAHADFVTAQDAINLAEDVQDAVSSGYTAAIARRTALLADLDDALAYFDEYKALMSSEDRADVLLALVHANDVLHLGDGTYADAETYLGRTSTQLELAAGYIDDSNAFFANNMYDPAESSARSACNPDTLTGPLYNAQNYLGTASLCLDDADSSIAWAVALIDSYLNH